MRLSVMHRACSRDIIEANLVFPKNELKTMSMSETRLNGFSDHDNIYSGGNWTILIFATLKLSPNEITT